ncbi:MAG TPA: lysine N(6)-hydroxylase/L-ornithine N(5)-oxygenase family protein [Bacillales bacterium]|nr:lysine N(6)-hydroxylase/L-ornithine N(5)-oxygenase family protein [Bacillales bacterium]
MTKMEPFDKVYDVIGVGIGPFNLGLACLLDKSSEVDALFFEKKSHFDWHPGMLIEGTMLQVPFMADLVTMADPTNPYSYLNYLKEHNRIYNFYFLQRLNMPRNEYNHYCQWAASQLESCRFGHCVEAVRYNEAEEWFEVEVVSEGEQAIVKTKDLVLGVGTVPFVPESFRGYPEEDVFHTSEFLSHRNRCRKAKSVTVVGSGQSAAEVFRELLKEKDECGYSLDWLTRSKSYFPMEETKLSLEHFSPDYVNYFYSLPQEKRDEIFPTQDLLYKGISAHTITDIYDLLYEHTVGGKSMDVRLKPLTKVNGITRNEDGTYRLHCMQWQQEKAFVQDSEVVVIATGYRPNTPAFMEEVNAMLCKDDKGRYEITQDYQIKMKKAVRNRIFSHTAISHSHGVGTTNLGLAVYRNKLIINGLTGKNIYPVDEDHVFQQFRVEE